MNLTQFILISLLILTSVASAWYGGFKTKEDKGYPGTKYREPKD